MIRIGIGHDTHRLQEGLPLWIGGLKIPHSHGCVAHSDGDVLLHALIDALLGAAALGDIGEWFPDTDPAWQGADSARLLEQVLQELHIRKYRIINVDAIVFTQKPKLSPLKPAIRERISSLLQLPPECVNVKAKTGELVGPIGREEAISAQVAVLVDSAT